MIRPLRRSEYFKIDFYQHYRWYLENASETIANEFLNAVRQTLRLLARQPEVGRRRNFRHPELQDIRSFRVHSPFDRLLIFYRVTDESIEVWRIMHGARNLPRRLPKPPDSD